MKVLITDRLKNITLLRKTDSKKSREMWGSMGLGSESL